MEGTPHYATVSDLVAERPVQPVYCIHPGRYRENTRQFLNGFPGRVLYAVKVNDDPRVLRLMHEAGVEHYDCASVAEVKSVQANCPGASCYFMNPVWPRGSARHIFEVNGVRHFVIDHPGGLEALHREVPLSECVVFVRMGVSHRSALNDLSRKFGAEQHEMAGLLEEVGRRGAEPALAFNVGSAVTDPEAYAMAIRMAREVLESLPFRIRLLDIGGGYPFSYPGFIVPEIREYWDTVRESCRDLPLAEKGEILTEPGRALAAPGLSAVVEVLQRRGDRLYINDGTYGIFWELGFEGHQRYPVTAYRDGAVMTGAEQEFSLFGPTCDAFDALPGRVPIPGDIRPGDYLEFSNIGAYSLSGRTRFNGLYSEHIVTIGDDLQNTGQKP